MSNILVTGGAGFIGSHLCKALLKNNHRVIIIDNFNDFYEVSIKKRNIEELKEMMLDEDLGFNALSVVTGDIREIKTLSRLFEFENIDIVVHLAAMAGVRPSIENPLLYNDVNINGTLNLLEMCKNHKVDKFIFASSSSVYGNNEKVPFSETDNVDYPISPYAATKKAGELLCHTYHKLYDMDMACLRFFTVYGPGQRPDLAIHKFTKLIVDEKEVPFFGDGSTQRDYTYIDDIIDGVTKAITWVCSGKGKYEIFNLGESNTITLKQMVETLEQAIGKKAKLKKMPMQLGDVNRTFADVSKAKAMLGYNPKMEFSEGIKRFMEWYKRGGY
jgi:UDP-glucuronate 4-epimerase